MARIRPTKETESITVIEPNTVFNELSLLYPVCHEFQPKISTSDICKCNRKKMHPLHEQGKSYDDGKTPASRDPPSTVKKVNPDQGSFPNGSLYAQLDLETPKEKVERILLDAWELPKPGLIMSIIGGKRYLKLTDRLETNFLNGMIDMTQKSGAWLFTNGYNDGVVQLVGQAIDMVKLTDPQKSIPAIGICKWGYIDINDYKKITSPKPADIKQDRKLSKGYLERNHSYYLMLDDGTIGNDDTNHYRTDLAVHVAKLQNENEFPLPVVTIVVEGDESAINNIYYDLKANIPVVIVGDSGGVADLFKRWLLYTKEFDDSIKYRCDKNIYDIHEVCEIPDKNSSTQNTHDTDKRLEKSDKNSSTRNTFEIHLDKSRKKLQEWFHKYESQIDNDINSIITYTDDYSPKMANVNDKEKDPGNLQLIDLRSKVMYCLQPNVRSNISIFNLNSDSDVSDTICRSICKSSDRLLHIKGMQRNDEVQYQQARQKKSNSYSTTTENKWQSENDIYKQHKNVQRSRLLNLTIDWGCIDVAKELVLKGSLDFIQDIQNPFIRSLEKNQPTFMYVFIKLGLNPSTIFFSGNDFKDNAQYHKFIQLLYRKEWVNRETSHLKHFIKTEKAVLEKRIDTIHALNKTLTGLIGDYMHKLYFDKKTDEIEDRSKHGLLENNRSNNQNDNKKETGINRDEIEKENYNIIMRDLFLWAILMNYTDMAKVLLAHMKYRICPALIATKIFKEYHHKATYSELKDSYKKSADYFEQYATNCLDKCDDHNMDEACEIVLQQNELYGYVSCLQVASDAKAKLFIASPCCVQAMNSIWYGKLYPKRSLISIDILIGVLSFGVVPFVVNFRESKEHLKIEHREPIFESYGITYSDPSTFEYPYDDRGNAFSRYIRRVSKFHEASCTKIYYRFISYLFFLLLFSYVLLFNFQPPTNQHPSIHWTEILTIMFVSSMLIEEIRYFLGLDNLTFCGKWKSYFRDKSKWLTLPAFVFFVIGLIVRFTYTNSEEQFGVARIIMAYDIVLWWLLCLSFIIVVPVLGPHLVAIGKMVKDLLFFIVIIIIVMSAYGVASRSMVYYPVANNFTTQRGGSIDTSFNGRNVFRQVFYPVYYFLYGNIGTELTNLDTNPDAGWSIATHVLLAFYLIFLNILLVNLLIAIFSKRFDEVYEETQKIWHSQQYKFTREYFVRSRFFPPINLIYESYRFCRMIFLFIYNKCYREIKYPKNKIFKIIPKKQDTIILWCEFEGASTYEYAQDEVKALAKSTTSLDLYNVRHKDERIDEYRKKLDTRNNFKQIMDDFMQLDTSITDVKKELKGSIETIGKELTQLAGKVDQLNRLPEVKQPSKNEGNTET